MVVVAALVVVVASHCETRLVVLALVVVLVVVVVFFLVVVVLAIFLLSFAIFFSIASICFLYVDALLFAAFCFLQHCYSFSKRHYKKFEVKIPANQVKWYQMLQEHHLF